MADGRFHPLEFNPATKEPFLRLLPPHQNIIITPYRPTDAGFIVCHLNDPRICATLLGPPYPYTEEHARFWIDQKTKETAQIIDTLEHGDEQTLVEGCPVSVL